MVVIKDPKEENKFHNENPSGKSEYRRGNPFKPRKCWGKKVIFTPTNINKKWTFNHLGEKLIENIKGAQNKIPLKIANTAPIERT